LAANVFLQSRQITVGGDDPFNGRAPPKIMQGRLALHAHAQKQNIHSVHLAAMISKNYYTKK
jgi:hypothetical protein